jgi:choline kinase
MQKITDALILMAGTGSRLNGPNGELPKPLLPISGQPLISYAINSFDRAGVTTLHVIVGAKAEQLVGAVEQLVPAHMKLNPIHNSQWQKQNGISVLSAAEFVRSPFFLAMGDHLFEGLILQRLLDQSDLNGLNLAVDRKIDSIFDLDDAMKVQTHADRVIAIGKQLAHYDAIDTGLFLAPPELFEFLERAKRNDDCALADGVRLMAAAEKVKAIDIADAWWQDVDTPKMRERAEAGVNALRNKSGLSASR